MFHILVQPSRSLRARFPVYDFQCSRDNPNLCAVTQCLCKHDPTSDQADLDRMSIQSNTLCCLRSSSQRAYAVAEIACGTVDLYEFICILRQNESSTNTRKNLYQAKKKYISTNYLYIYIYIQTARFGSHKLSFSIDLENV